MRRTLDDWNYRDGHMNNGMGWFIAFLVLALVIAAVVALVVAITRNSASARPDQTPAAPNKARAILDERFARGDIAVDEYRERRTALDD